MSRKSIFGELPPINVSYTDALGNTIDNTFTAKSGYFPFDTRYVRNDFVGASSGTYKNNITSAVFKFLKEKAEKLEIEKNKAAYRRYDPFKKLVLEAKEK